MSRTTRTTETHSHTTPKERASLQVRVAASWILAVCVLLGGLFLSYMAAQERSGFGWAWTFAAMSVLFAATLGLVVWHMSMWRGVAGPRPAADAMDVARTSLLAEPPDVIFFIRRDGQFVDCRAPRLVGLALDPEQIVDRNIRDIAPAHVADIWLTGVTETLDSDSLRTIQFHLMHHGRRREYEARLVACGRDMVGAIARDVTEKWEAEQRLSESRHMLAKAQEIADLGCWNWDLTINHLWWSDQMYQLFDLSPHEFDGDLETAFRRRVHPDDVDRVRRGVALFKRAKQGRSSRHIARLTFRVLRQGEVRVFASEGELVFDAKGQPCRIVGTVQDITDRRRNELELEHRLTVEAMISEMSMAFINLPPHLVDVGVMEALQRLGRFLHADRGFVMRLNEARDLYQNTHEWCDDAVSSEYVNRQNVRVDRLPWLTEQLLARQPLEVHSVEDMASESDRNALLGAQVKAIVAVPLVREGLVIGALGYEYVQRQPTDLDGLSALKMAAEIFTNALLHRASADALRAGDQRYRSVVETAGNVIVIIDTDLNIQEWNVAAEDQLGWSRGDALSKNFADLCVAGDQNLAVSAKITRVLRGSSAKDEEFDVLTRDGERRTMLWNGTLLRDPSNTPTGAVFVGQDITERKIAEAHLQESREHYRGMAESNRLLLSEVNHRVRNNLASLLSLMSIVRKQASGVDDFANGMRDRVMGMSHVHNLLVEANWQDLDVRQLLDGLTSSVRFTAPHPVAVELIGPAAPLTARQATPLAMALLEMFNNSCKYGAHTSPQGQVKVQWEIIPEGRREALRLQWTETGGPTVSGAPKPSLGTRLIEGFINFELGGQVRLNYPPWGADHLLEFTLSSPDSEESPTFAGSGSEPLDGT